MEVGSTTDCSDLGVYAHSLLANWQVMSSSVHRLSALRAPPSAALYAGVPRLSKISDMNLRSRSPMEGEDCAKSFLFSVGFSHRFAELQ